MSKAGLTVIGNHVSPYVRKVLAVCEMKGLAYRVDSIVPFYGSDRFTQLSPLRRIPVLIDGADVINDSSVICEYLEETAPQVPLLAGTPAERARIRFLDEFADTLLADVLIWRIFGKALVAPAVFGTPRDLDAVQRVVKQELPAVLDHLEVWAPSSGFIGGATANLADISVASHFANLRWARQTVDAARWPKTAAWVTRVETETPLGRLNAIGDKILRTPADGHRAVLQSFGVATTQDSVGGAAATRGPMTVI